jgi:hypothetical protein
MMNPIDETPLFDHDGRSKRRRLSGPSPGDTPSISQYISSFNQSPINASSRLHNGLYLDDENSMTTDLNAAVSPAIPLFEYPCH